MEIFSIIPKMIFIMAILSSIKTISSIPFYNAVTFQDWYSCCFHIEMVNVDLPYDILDLCYLYDA